MNSRTPSAPTMRQLADALGVSVSTVSLAMRNDSRVAAATRERVQAYAREQGYHLNPALTEMMSKARRSIRAGYRETLGWINTWDHPEYFTHRGVDYQRMLWKGAEERAVSLGYRLDSFWLADPQLSSQRLSNILTARGVRGILLPPLPRPHGHLSLQWDQFYAVSLSLTLTRPYLHCVAPDHFMNLRLMLRKLKRRGYRRIGMLLNEGYDDRLDNRFSAAYFHFQQTIPEKHRIPVHTAAGVTCDSRIAHWLKTHRPDAVITMGVYRNLRDLDVGDPEYSRRLGVVLIGYATTDQGYAAIDENPYQIGRASVDALIAGLNRNERGLPNHPTTTLIPGTWVEGGSLPSLTGSH